MKSLTKNQWLGIVVLAAIIAVFIGGFYLVDYLFRPTETTPVQLDSITASQIQILENSSKKKHYVVHHDTIALFLHPFDPNTADSLELLQLGFKPWMVRNMLKYRAKHGVWRTNESLKKIYGMTDDLYTQIEPYIVINLPADTIRDSISSEKPLYPVKKDTILNLNTCDTAELQLIRGIRGYTARAIVRYRNQLGGFVSVSQLREVKEIPADRVDSLLPYFFVDPDLVTPIPVNQSSAERLSRHPYLSFSQAKAVYELRRTNFKLNDIDQLQQLDCISEDDIIRLKPYLSFE